MMRESVYEWLTRARAPPGGLIEPERAQAPIA